MFTCMHACCTPGHAPGPIGGGVALLVADLVDRVVNGAADLVADLAELLAEGELAPVLVPLIVPLPPALARVIPVSRWRRREERGNEHLQLGDFADAFIQSDSQPFMHTLPHRGRSGPLRATASWTGAVRGRRLAQRHNTRRSRDRTSNLPVTV